MEQFGTRIYENLKALWWLLNDSNQNFLPSPVTCRIYQTSTHCSMYMYLHILFSNMGVFEYCAEKEGKKGREKEEEKVNGKKRKIISSTKEKKEE